MIERQPYLPRFMAGRPGNPLGARAMYLGSTVYRIHGTNQPSTIGKFVSSGCIGMLNEDVSDLFERVKVGTRVVVMPGGPAPGTTTASAAPQPGGPAAAPAPPQPPPSWRRSPAPSRPLCRRCPRPVTRSLNRSDPIVFEALRPPASNVEGESRVVTPAAASVRP